MRYFSLHNGVELFPTWVVGKAYAVSDRAQYNGTLYKCVQAHTSQADWAPDATHALWTGICETHGGTLTDPIPYNGNMALENGKYYIQDYAIYRCSRDTGIPVYNRLAELVGIYVETV